MRWVRSAASFALLLSNSCAVAATGPANGSGTVRSSATCDPQLPGSLIALPPDGPRTPTNHTIVASTLTLVEAKHVRGPCVEQIARFNVGHAFLRSGDIFLVREDGTTTWSRARSMLEATEQPVQGVASLRGYSLVMAERLAAATVGSRGQPFLGLFKRHSDYVIARFDVLHGKSGDAEVLIRSRAPIVSVDYLPAPDTPEGRIGFVQLEGSGKASLYSYQWRHGRLVP